MGSMSRFEGASLVLNVCAKEASGELELQLLDPDTQSENKRAQSLTKRMILDEKVDVIQGAIASSEREAILSLIHI